MKHKFESTNYFTADSKSVVKCSYCGKKTTNEQDRTLCTRSTHYPLVASASQRYKQSTFQTFNKKIHDQRQSNN